MHDMVGALVPHCSTRRSEANLNRRVVFTLLKQLMRGKGKNTRARSLASPRRAGRGVAKGAGARHAREWSCHSSPSCLRVRSFVLLLEIFACMEKIALSFLESYLEGPFRKAIILVLLWQ